MDNCFPVDPARRNVDLEEIFGGPGISFSPLDPTGPPGAEAFDLEDGIPRFQFEERQGPMAIMGRFLRVPKGWMADFEARSGVPLWTWWRSIELGRLEMDKFLAEPSYTVLPKIFENFTKREKELTQLLMEAEGTPSYAEVSRQVGEKVTTAQQQLVSLYYDYFAKAGLAPEDVSHILTNVIPGIRQKGGDYIGWSQVNAVPKIGKLLQRQLTTGEIPVDREMDAAILARRVFRAVAEERYLAPHWNLVRTQFQAYSKDMPSYVGQIFHRYLMEVRHAPDETQRAVAAAMSRVVDGINSMASRGGPIGALFKKLTKGGTLSKEEYLDLTSTLVGFNYQLNLAWNPGAVLRQYMQTLQTVVPHMGVGDTVSGWRQAMRWMKDEELQKFYEQRGVVTRDVTHELFRQVEDAMERFNPGGVGGEAKKFLDYIRRNGTRYFKTGDDFNRVVSYHAMTEHATKHARAFVEGKKSWTQFLEDSKLDTLDAKEGPFINVVRERLSQGDVEGAVHEMALKFTQDTQFMYSRGNNPYVMQGTVGRFLGQYGTWPMQFTEYMRNMFLRGSYKNRALAFARWSGINAAMLYGASSVFGVDMGRWTFFSPMAYTGGPFLELGQQAAAVGAVQMGSTDPVDRIQASRFGPNLVSQAVAPVGRVDKLIEATDKLSNAAYGDFLRMFLGFPKEKGK